jgi:leucyl/phenylalanyl-tRNA---protein transferase
MNGNRPKPRPTIYLLGEDLVFPPVHGATPEGLVAVGGDLSVPRLLLAYRSGLFPWYSEGSPILWFSPDPRMILFPLKLHVSDSLRRTIAAGRFTVTFDRDFPAVIRNCQEMARPGQDGTWITEDMCQAYQRLHEAGHAHSVEVWQDDELAGGLYGIRMGRCYFGESMFSAVRDASKVGFVHLVRRLIAEGVHLIDCQVHTEHLARFGAEPVPRTRFLELLTAALRGE